MNDIQKLLSKIDDIVYNKTIQMNMPIINDDLGGIIYFATRYKSTGQIQFKEKSLTLFNKLLDVYENYELSSSFLQGFEGIFWTVQYLYKNKIIDDPNILDSMEEYLVKSINIDIKFGDFDSLHGYIGKLQYFILTERKQELFLFVDNITKSLYEESIKHNNGLCWFGKGDSEKYIVNLGLAHGIPSILVFLTKVVSMGYNNPLAFKLIEGIMASLQEFRNNLNEISTFSDKHNLNGLGIKTSCRTTRLAWCYGDLGVAYAIYYTGHTLKNEEWKQDGITILKKLCQRGISDSGLNHFDDYSFFDTAFCHGISGISYLLYKLNVLIKDEDINKRLQYWNRELIKNTKIMLAVSSDDIYYPFDRQNEDYSNTIDNETILSGVTGTGLVLQTLDSDFDKWSHMFSIY